MMCSSLLYGFVFNLNDIGLQSVSKDGANEPNFFNHARVTGLEMAASVIY